MPGPHLLKLMIVFGLICMGCNNRPNGGIDGKSAGPSASGNEQHAVEGPVLKVENTETQLGELRVPIQHKVTFALCNAGGRLLQIESIEVSCACAVAELETESILPGGTSELDVMVSVEEVGSHSAQVIVHTNDIEVPRLPLLIVWEGIADAQATPPQIDFGDIRPGATVSEQLHILLHKPPFDWDQYEVSASGVNVTQTEQISDQEAAYDVTVTANQLEGRQRAFITLQQIDAEAPLLNVSTTWNVVDIVTVAPSEVFLGAGEPEQLVSRTIVLRSNVSLPVKIAQAILPGQFNDFEVSFPAAPANVIMIELSGSLPQMEGAIKGNLEIHLAQPEPRKLIIPVTALVTAGIGEMVEE